MAEYKKPLPAPDHDTITFWEGCKRHELLLQKCDTCSSYRYPPRSICPECFSVESTWDKVSGKGEVYTYTVARIPLNPAWEQDIPYTIGIILLDEGVKMVSNIVDCKPEDITIGMKVEVVFDDVTEKFSLPKFKPVHQS
jgi:uncharacterized OB-fold protein